MQENDTPKTDTRNIEVFRQLMDNQLEFIMDIKTIAITILQRYIKYDVCPSYYFLEDFLMTWIAWNTQSQPLAIYVGQIKKAYLEREAQIQVLLKQTLNAFPRTPHINQLQTFTFPYNERRKALIFKKFFDSEVQTYKHNDIAETIQHMEQPIIRKRNIIEIDHDLTTEIQCQLRQNTGGTTFPHNLRFRRRRKSCH